MKSLDIVLGVLVLAAAAYVVLQPDPQHLPPEPQLPEWKASERDPSFSIAPRAELPDDSLAHISILRREFNRFGVSCDVRFDAQVIDGLLDIRLDAPCRQNESGVLGLAGLEVAYVTSDAGTIQATVPVLQDQTEVTFRFEDGITHFASAEINHPPVTYARILEWSGPSAIELHSFEQGADIGDTGHVWLGARQGIGQFSVLGDITSEERRAQIYSMQQEADAYGAIRTHIALPVTQDSCGQALDARIATVYPGQPPDWTDLTLMVPDCTHIGETLRLKALFPDIRLQAPS